MSMAVEHQMDMMYKPGAKICTDRIRHKCLVHEAYNQLRDNPQRFFETRKRRLKALGNRVIYCQPLISGYQWVMIWQTKTGVLRTFAVERAGRHWAKLPWHFAQTLRDDILQDIAIDGLFNAHHMFEEFERSQLIEKLAERVIENIKEGYEPNQAARAVIADLVAELERRVS